MDPTETRFLASRLFQDPTPLYHASYTGKQMGSINKGIRYAEQTLPSLQGKSWVDLGYDTGQYKTLGEGLQINADLLKNRSLLMKNDIDFIKSQNSVLGDIAEKSPEYINQIVGDIKSGKTNNIEQYVKDLILQDNRFSRNMNLSGVPSEESVKTAFSTINGHTLGGDPSKKYLNKAESSKLKKVESLNL